MNTGHSCSPVFMVFLPRCRVLKRMRLDMARFSLNEPGGFLGDHFEVPHFLKALDPMASFASAFTRTDHFGR
jgi:hypothetical protein